MMLASGAPSAIFASIADEQAVATCHGVGVDARVELALGGKLDPVHGTPLSVVGDVVRLACDDKTNRQAVVRVGGVGVIVTERRTPFHRIVQFRRLGLEPGEHKIVMVKIGYLEPELSRAAGKALLALTPGAVNQDIASLRFHRIERPIYPLDDDFPWRPRAWPRYNRDGSVRR